jgi:RHS repeat-associated protein
MSTMSTMSSTINLDKKFTYDQFERVKNEMIKIGDKVIDLETNFKDGKLDSLKPFVTSTNINLHGKLQGYQLSNGMKFQIEYDYLGRLRNIEAITLNGRINSSFKRDQYGRLEQVNSTVLPENNYMYMADTRLDLEEAKINLTSVKRDADSRVIELKASNLLFKWQGHTLESVKFKGVNYKQHYGIDEQYIGTCKENATSTKDCVLKISDDEFLVEGIYFKKIIISGVIVGILVNDQFYPAILDHNGAVVGLYKVDGSGIEFLRSFNAFGVKESVSGNKKLESLMPFTFGHLIQVSFFNGELLQSQTRAYLPSTGEWASVDAYALWNPNELEKNVGNWNAIEYASGDPVNKLDVSGHVVVVNARELNFGGSLGKIGAHTYTEVRRDNGEVFQVMGSGHPGSKLEVKVGANIDHQNGFDNVASIEIKSPNGISQDDWDKKVIEAGNNVKNDWDGKLDYSILGGNRETGANCHGVTREVLDRAGGQAKQLDNFNPLGLNPGLNR